MPNVWGGVSIVWLQKTFKNCVSLLVSKNRSQKLINPFVSETTESAWFHICASPSYLTVGKYALTNLPTCAKFGVWKPTDLLFKLFFKTRELFSSHDWNKQSELWSQIFLGSSSSLSYRVTYVFFPAFQLLDSCLLVIKIFHNFIM